MESGIQLKESGIPLTIGIQNSSSTDKNWDSVPGIPNPQREIQNPRLSWISNVYFLHLFVLHWSVTIRLYVPRMLAAQVLKPYGLLYVWLLSHTSVIVFLISNGQCKKIQTYNPHSSDRLENIPPGSCSILLLCRYLQE